MVYALRIAVKRKTWLIILALLWWQSERLRHEYTVENNSRLLNGKTALSWNEWIVARLFPG